MCYLNQKLVIKMNAKIYLLVVAVLVATGTFIAVPAIAASVDQQQLIADMDVEVFGGTVVEVSDRSFILDTGEGMITIIVPGPQEEATAAFQELGLQAGDAVTIEGIIRDTSSGRHTGECVESLDVSEEHIVALSINGTTVFTPGSMGHRGSGMGNHYHRNQ